MKLYSFIILLLVFFTYCFIGCDSVSDSKPVSTTPPSLISPADLDSGVSITPTFTWSGTADKLQVSSNSAFSSVLYSSDVTGTSHTMQGYSLAHGVYYFWRAGRTSGATVYWSTNYHKFKTQ